MKTIVSFLARGRGRAAGLAMVAVVFVPLLASCNVRVPVTFTVGATDDAVDAVPGDGQCATAAPARCTLRAAVMEANATDSTTYQVTIELQPSTTYQLTLAGSGEDGSATGDLDTSADMVVDGHGATIAGTGDDRVLEHHAGTVELNDLTLSGGVGQVGGILNHADLALHLVRLTQNELGTEGGAVLLQDGGWAYLDRVSVERNYPQAPDDLHPTDVATAGVMVEAGGMVVRDSTIAENFGKQCSDPLIPGEGPWCLVADSTDYSNAPFSPPASLVNDGGNVVIVSSTLSTNKGASANEYCMAGFGCWFTPYRFFGPGLRANGGSTTIVKSTILANTQDITGTAVSDVHMSGSVVSSCTAAVTSDGYNIEDGPAGCFPAGPTDVVGSNYIQRTLQDNGGPTRTHLPTFPSVVNSIPAGTPQLCDGSLPTDQRGLPQPVGGACDRGSVERQPTDP